MTREEAIQVLSQRPMIAPSKSNKQKMFEEAIDMAIEALSAEPKMKVCEERQNGECPFYTPDWLDDDVSEPSDLISRADAIEAVASITMSIHLSDVICNKLMALPSAEAEWIPVSERLPKEKQEVYVTVYFIEGDAGRAYGYMDGFGKWHLYSTVEGTLNSGYEVIAWMPLPEPYRKESEVGE